MRPHHALGGAALIALLATLGCSDDSTTIVNAPRFTALSDSTFVVAADGVLEINDFAGTVTVTPGGANAVDVTVEKWAAKQADLNAIDVELVEVSNGVRITATNPMQRSQVGVDLDVAIPTDMRPVIEVGAGAIAYRGPAPGETHFGAGAGDITLTLPADVNVELSLTAGAGSVRVDFPVTGQVGDHAVNGVIGTGADGKIVAQVGAGNIVVVPE